MPVSEKFIRLGKILQEWGIRGQLRFISFNSGSDLYPKLTYLESEAPDARRFELESAKRHGRYWLLKLKDYESPEQARELRGIILGLPRAALPKPKRGEIYLSDLEGLEVRTEGGRAIGRVAGFLHVGESEVLRIARESGDEALVPYRNEFIAETRLSDGYLVLNAFAEELL